MEKISHRVNRPRSVPARSTSFKQRPAASLNANPYCIRT